MKIMLISTPSIMSKTYKSNLIIMSITLMIILMKMQNHPMMMNNLLTLDMLSLIMIMLTLMSTMLIILSSDTLKKIHKTIIPIFFILIITFSTNNLFYFYIMFELVLIPTLILITKLGKQPERLQASIYLLIYTISASLPLLVSIISLKNNQSLTMIHLNLMNLTFPLFISLAFLVKMPMFLTHLWLPKAHVEAPLEGSMILAAVLLKLGGYGLIRFLPMCTSKIKTMNSWIISISLIGATATSLNCIRQKDLKSLIAYSSVAHMGLVLAGIFSNNLMGISGSIMMMIAHGLSSSALFFLVNDLYTKLHTRNIIMFKGLIIASPNMAFWWFMFMAVNISAPPTINTISEIFIMSSLIMWSKTTIIPIMIMSFTAASFSLSLFINISHNKNETINFKPSSQKSFLSLFMHIIPLILLLLKMESMNFINSSKSTMTCGVMNMFMMKYSMNMLFYSLIPLSLSIVMLFNNTFISMDEPLINMHSMSISISILMDWISMSFLSTVMLISSMIMMFSMFYIPIKEHNQFSLLMLMFILSMSTLILSDNIIFILLGWDGLGLSSYILVIYYQNFSSAASGSITLLSNRIGDIMILISMSIMMMNSNWNFNMNKEYNLLSMMLLMIAAFSKSAQFPFSAWLPAAMAAPTPISALVHSSTLVTAGVFLSIRIMNNIHPSTTLMLMLSSTATAIYAGLAANWEQDMKKIIALSTLSQIAMMMFAVSLKSPMLAFFHLITHALFKSTMFLCAGTMIHNSSYQDMRMMQTNNKNSPLTPSILGISSLALMGLPFMSGFFSKDSIIELMLNSKSNLIMFTLMILSIGLTASYTIRLSVMSNNSFKKSKPDMNIHKSMFNNPPISMMAPLSITMGSTLMWIMKPYQMFMFPNLLKLSIIFTLTMGSLLGLTLSFKNKSFTKMGESSISLWFIHFMTSFIMHPPSNLMNTFNKNDKMWQEMYGPTGIFNSTKTMSKTPQSTKTITLLTMLMLTIIPILI